MKSSLRKEVMRRKSFFLFCLLFLGFSSVVNATTITFEPFLDEFFVYDNVVLMTTAASGNGYASVQDYTGTTHIVRNSAVFPSSSFTMSSPGTFDLTSLVIAGAFGNQTLTIEGLRNSSMIYTVDLGITTTAQLFSPTGWDDIDQFIIYKGSDYVDVYNPGFIRPIWALDNIVLTENPVVPVPGAILLFRSGLIGLIGVAKC